MGDLGKVLAARERYGELLACLTPQQLVVVALLLEGMNGQEIAEELGITRKAVYVRLRGAKRRLRAE